MRSAPSPIGAVRAPCPTPATPYRIERRMGSSNAKSRERMSRNQRELSSVEIMAISERETFDGLVDISGKQIHVERQQNKRKGQNSRGTLLVLKLPAVTMVSDDNSKPLMMAKNEEKERSSLPYVRHAEIKGNVVTPKVSKPIQTFILPDLESSKEKNDMTQMGLFGDSKLKRAGISDHTEADRRKTQPVGKIRLWKEVKKKDDTQQQQQTEKRPGKRSKREQKWEWSPRGKVFPEIQRSVTVEMNGRLSRINMEETLPQIDAKASNRGEKSQLSPESSFDSGSVKNKSRKSSTKSQRDDVTEGKGSSSGGSSPRVVLPEIPPKLAREKTHEIERKTKKHRRKPSVDDASSSHSVVLRTSSDNGLTVDAKHIMPLPKVTVPQTKMATQGERKSSDKATEYEEPAYIAKLKRREKRRRELYDLLRYLPPLSKVSRTYAVNVISLGIDKDDKTEVEGEGSEVSSSPGDSPRFPPCTCSHRTVAHPGIKVSKSVSPRSPYLSKMAGDLDEDKMADRLKTRQTVSERASKRTREEELSKRTALGMFRTIQLFENRKRGPVDKRYKNIYRLDPRYLNKRASREKGG